MTEGVLGHIFAAAEAAGAFDLNNIIPLLLTAGGAAFLGTLVTGIKELRSGARSGRRELVRDLMTWRDDADEKARTCSADADFWRDLAAQRGAQLREKGIAPAVPDPVPPSARTPKEPAVGRRRRAHEDDDT